MKIPLYFIVVILFSITAFTQTTISGDISGMKFDSTGSPYIVKNDLIVETGKKTAIKPGCVFLFRPFTGILVKGSLEIAGESEMPVVFTSINDSLYNKTFSQKPDLFDWNGITIANSAENVNLSNFIVSYSVYGVKSKKDDITIERGIFRQNGQFNFTVNDRIERVEYNMPFSYNISENNQELKVENFRNWLKPTGISSIVIGTACLGVMGYFLYRADDNNTNYEITNNIDNMQNYLKKRDDSVRGAIITAVVGGILVPAGSGLLLWNHRIEKIKTHVSFYPVTGEFSGFQLVVKF